MCVPPAFLTAVRMRADTCTHSILDMRSRTCRGVGRREAAAEAAEETAATKMTLAAVGAWRHFAVPHCGWVEVRVRNEWAVGLLARVEVVSGVKSVHVGACAQEEV